MSNKEIAERVTNRATTDEIVAQITLIAILQLHNQTSRLRTITSEIPEAAFDIFDSLNTTGIPLTAIEL